MVLSENGFCASEFDHDVPPFFQLLDAGYKYLWKLRDAISSPKEKTSDTLRDNWTDLYAMARDYYIEQLEPLLPKENCKACFTAVS